MPYENMAPAVLRPTADNYHALLFVGVCNVQRYVLSLVRWTNLLHEMYGYPLGNIRILVGPYSTSSWGTMVAGTDVTYNATMADLDTALAAYATGSGDPHELGSNDNLFIFTFNHGGNDADGLGSYLCCDSFTSNYYASAFAARTGAVHCRQIVLLAAQCFSGGFVDPFIDGLWSGTRGAVLAGCRSDQVTWEAVFDKVCASALNGRMVQDPLDDNIDLGITGDGIGVYTVPGYNTNRVDWGPTGCISTREAFNWVYDHYANVVHPTYPSVDEIPLYRQTPWMDPAGQPLHIRLGEPDLAMQDNPADTGAEPSTGDPWHSPDLYADNTDQFPGTTLDQYVPAHDNRFLVRTANRGTAPTDDVWRNMEVRGLGFTGGPVGPPRIDRAVEASGGVIVSARLRPGRAHTQYERILIGADYGHGCVSAAASCGTDPMSHPLWNIQQDNDQVQRNLDPAPVSGSQSVPAGATNSNAGKLMRTIPVLAEIGGTFELRVAKPKAEFPVRARAKKSTLELRKGKTGEFQLEITLPEKVKDGARGELAVTVRRNREVVGGVTFLLMTGTGSANVAVYDARAVAARSATVILTQPEDPRELVARTDRSGVARFGPLNPGFYFARVQDSREAPTRLFIGAGGVTEAKLTAR